MYLAAVNQLASTAGIWAIVIVAVICLAFWLIMVVTMAERGYARDRRRKRQQPGVPHIGGRDLPVVGGMHVSAGGRSIAPSRDEPATAMPEPADVPRPRSSEPSQPAGPSPLDLGGPVPPRQRESETDQPARQGRAN